MSVRQKLALAVVAVVVVFGLALLFKLGGFDAELAQRIANDGNLFLPLVVVAALIDSINPCAFSVLFLTIAFLFSLGHRRAMILKIGGFYIFGVFTAYLLIGLGILRALQLFNIPGFMGKAGAILLVTIGAIGLLNAFLPSSPIKFRIPQVAHKKIAVLMEKGSMPSAFVLGALIGIYGFPCTGWPYLMILGLLHDYRTYFEGIGYLLLYNAVFILPLVAILFVVGNEAVLAKVDALRKENSRSVRVWASVAMILLGAFILAL